MKRLISLSTAMAFVLLADVANGLPGNFFVDQIYSNADRTVQFVVIRDGGATDCDAGENLWAGQTLRSVGSEPARVFVFPTNLPTCHTSGRRMLIATQGFADLNIVTPDYVIPNGFIQTPSGQVTFADVSFLVYTALPNDGVHAIDRNGAPIQNLATNVAGASASVVPSSAPGIAKAVEYYHAAFGHYFVTAIADEIGKLDSGVFTGWTRTGEAFNVYTVAAADLFPVCRFFTIAFPPTSSHFYAPRGLGCEGTLANKDWQFEGDVFYTPLPDSDGTCPSGSVPVYRLYNNGQGGAPNHRFTTSQPVRSQMLAAGYIAEGRGIGVGMCSPN